MNVEIRRVVQKASILEILATGDKNVLRKHDTIMELTTYRQATGEDLGAVVWFGELCHYCLTPICFRGERDVRQYYWHKVSHSCSEVLRKRIEALEERIRTLEANSGWQPAPVYGPSKQPKNSKRFLGRNESPFLDEAHYNCECPKCTGEDIGLDRHFPEF